MGSFFMFHRTAELKIQLMFIELNRSVLYRDITSIYFGNLVLVVWGDRKLDCIRSTYRYVVTTITYINVPKRVRYEGECFLRIEVDFLPIFLCSVCKQKVLSYYLDKYYVRWGWGREWGRWWRWGMMKGGEDIINVEYPLWNLLSVLPLRKSFFIFLRNLFFKRKCFQRIWQVENEKIGTPPNCLIFYRVKRCISRII